MSSAHPKAHEPSMEEILASIRRIISDDQDSFAPARPAVDLYAVEAEEDEPRDSSAGIVSAQASADDGAVAPVAPVALDVPDVPAAHDEPAAPAAPAAPVDADPGARPDGSSDRTTLPETNLPLLSEAVSASIAGTFGRLEAHGASAGASSFEETVKEMMRPMLKAWLDQNLPGIVERLVQAEIERVTRA
ncbi:MAG: DUF2497 domain-containing protein [Microvirga sp.]